MTKNFEWFYTRARTCFEPLAIFFITSCFIHAEDF